MFGDKVALLLDERYFRDEEYDGLALGCLFGCDPSNEEDANEGLAAAGSQGCDDVAFLGLDEDLFLVLAGDQRVPFGCGHGGRRQDQGTQCITCFYSCERGSLRRKGKEGNYSVLKLSWSKNRHVHCFVLSPRVTLRSAAPTVTVSAYIKVTFSECLPEES